MWEWRSQTYLLKQQGHSYDVSTVAFSPDGSTIATGADDNKVAHLPLLTARLQQVCGPLMAARAPSCLHSSDLMCLSTCLAPMGSL